MGVLSREQEALLRTLCASPYAKNAASSLNPDTHFPLLCVRGGGGVEPGLHQGAVVIAVSLDKATGTQISFPVAAE